MTKIDIMIDKESEVERNFFWGEMYSD